MATSNSSPPDECHASSIGIGRVTAVTRRSKDWESPAKATEFPSSLLPDCDINKYAKTNSQAQLRNVRALRWVIACVIALAVGAQLHSHAVTVDPCVRAQMSLGMIERFSSASSSTTTPAASSSYTIPKIIHQQWRTSTVENDESLYKNDKWGDWHAAWHRLFPESEGYKHMLWTDKMMLDFITEHYPWFLPIYNSYPENIQRVDAARYFILYHYGGVYADMDYEPLTNFWKWIPSDRVSLIGSPYQVIEGEAQNSLMASPQGHPFWNATFKVLADNTKEWDVLSSTGPKMIGAVMERTPADYWYVLPCENFNRIPSAENGASPWLTVIGQQMIMAIPQKSCGAWERQGPGDCQFGRHHNTVSWVKQKGFFKYAFDHTFSTE